MVKPIDARGMACPTPVLMTKNAIKNSEVSHVEVIVDTEASKENVSRFLKSRHFSVTALPDGSDYRIQARRQTDASVPQQEVEPSRQDAVDTKERTMVLITSDRWGSGDDQLGRQLIANFLKTIQETEKQLWRLVLVNNGVRLAVDGSPVLEDLVAQENRGLMILVCGTCLSHLGLMEDKKVGETSNMLEIVTAMQRADKVINVG